MSNLRKQAVMPPAENIPYGFCHCGCGRKTEIFKRNRTNPRQIKGEPHRFILGHKKLPTYVDAAPFKIDGAYCRLIPLTRGYYAIVDATDYRWLMQWHWQASSSRGLIYAVSRGRIRMHRLLLNPEDGVELDHRNGNTTDNRRKNLRPCEHRENVKNARKRKDNTAGYRGVYRKGKKFAVEIQSDGRRVYRGVFPTAIEAARVYDESAREHHGEFANFNLK